MRIDGRELNLVYDIDSDDETYALKNTEITLDHNGIKGIIGPSGSGKSSLLYVLSGLKKPTSGTVYFDDVDVEAYSSEERDAIRKKSFGFIFQKHFLIDYLSVLDNVLVPLNSSSINSQEAGMILLEHLGIKHLAKKRPCELSGGQRQRTAIARALINKPEVVFADEPTASLDHNNAMEVMSILNDFKNSAIILVVTHDRSILSGADKVIEMWDGRII